MVLGNALSLARVKASAGTRNSVDIVSLTTAKLTGDAHGSLFSLARTKIGSAAIGMLGKRATRVLRAYLSDRHAGQARHARAARLPRDAARRLSPRGADLPHARRQGWPQGRPPTAAGALYGLQARQGLRGDLRSGIPPRRARCRTSAARARSRPTQAASIAARSPRRYPTPSTRARRCRRPICRPCSHPMRAWCGLLTLHTHRQSRAPARCRQEGGDVNVESNRARKWRRIALNKGGLSA
jgi:hypothetical protein